jgi:hypothetical protein
VSRFSRENVSPEQLDDRADLATPQIPRGQILGQRDGVKELDRGAH